MGKHLSCLLVLLATINAQVTVNANVVCVNGTDFFSEEGVKPDTSLKKYEGAVFLLVGFGGLAILGAILYICIRGRVFQDLHSCDTAFDAGGNVSTTLTAVGFATQLLWPGDLLQSVTLCVKLGIAGAFWYCGTAIINMSLFPLLSFKFKTRAPGAKTYLQIIKARFGTPTHVVFIFFAILVNLVILSTVFVGGIAVLQATISDASPEYCVVILAALCGCYALIGGLGSTFYVNYLTAVVTYTVVSALILKVVYAEAEPFGSLEEIYERVNCLPDVDGNRDGSRFTFLSEESLIFGAQILFLVSSITYCDQASWQSRIAARPVQGALGFLVGSFLWFTVPATVGLVAGVAYLSEAARNQTFALSLDQIDSGIVTAYVTEDAMGRGGAIMMLTMLTMVTMSTGSSEIMGIASIVVYDIYQTYFRPFRRDLLSSHCVCCGLAKAHKPTDLSIASNSHSSQCACPHVSQCQHCHDDVQHITNRAASRSSGQVLHYTCPHHRDVRMYQDSVRNFKSWCILWVTVALVPFGVIINAVELDLNWTMMAGVILTVPSFPSVILAICWVRTTSFGMIVGSIFGLITGCAADAAVAVLHYDWEGGFIRATSAPYSVLAGSGTGFFVSLIFTFIVSLGTNNVKSQEDADAIWQKLREIDNPLYPWSLRFAREFPHLTDGVHRPTQKQLEQASRNGKCVSIVGSILFIIVFIFVIPGSLASLEVMTFEEFEIWVYVLTIALFVSTVVIIIVTPLEEIKAILTQVNRNKRGHANAHPPGDTGMHAVKDAQEPSTNETTPYDTPRDDVEGVENNAFQSDNP